MYFWEYNLIFINNLLILYNINFRWGENSFLHVDFFAYVAQSRGYDLLFDKITLLYFKCHHQIL